MLNEVNLMGRLTKDPELRRTGTGVAVTSFRIAVERDIKPKDSDRAETDFIDCVAWRGAAEFIEKYFGKGRMIAVHGKLRQRGYTTKEGEKRQVIEVEVENAYFGDSKKSDSPIEEKSTGYNTSSSEPSDDVPDNSFEPIEDKDEKLPF